MSRTFYDPSTGAGIYETDSNVLEPYPDWVDEGYDTGLWYFPAGVPTERVAMAPTVPAALEQNVPAAFSGFPVGSQLTLDGAEHILDDGAFSFMPTTVGLYRVEVYHPAHLLYERFYDVT